MDKQAVDFINKFNFIGGCIFGGSFNTYEDITFHRISVVWKCYDVCKIIMFKISLIDRQQIFIIAKNVGNAVKFFLLRFKYSI